ncbi:MAG: RecQ family ATP-dependent DNA helicase, partial [Bifidobacterium crudilactis]|nr:RecQ family ATP-dependent DNA helicase [Bifidobacterium crudilactis]
MTPVDQALDALHTYFGYDSFRLGQDRVVDAILTGHDSLAVMPTGAGKSICYQVPATVLPGVTIVISPLVSLMRDQVDALDDAGIAAAFVNSTQSTEEQRAVISQAAQGSLRLLYVAPERLSAPSFRGLCEHLQISMIAVDEAHCVSQWGQDFRPSYLDIGGFIEGFVRRPIVAAFTATATEQVRADIVRMLNLHDPVMTVTGFDRPNLFLDVIRLSTKQKSEWISRYVHEHADDSGIVYCATRKETDAVAQELRREGVTAAAFHAGLQPEERARAQRAFVNDEVQVVAATNAFGMGIDKSNVRFVIHHNMPESIEAYYQEAGRAGRDGEPARCTLLWNESDIVTRRRLLDMGNANDRLSAEE